MIRRVKVFAFRKHSEDSIWKTVHWGWFATLKELILKIRTLQKGQRSPIKLLNVRGTECLFKEEIARVHHNCIHYRKGSCESISGLIQNLERIASLGGGDVHIK